MRILVALLLLPAILSAQENRLGFRDDHTVLVGKQPFFPIGLYYCGEEFDDTTGKLLRELRDYGFNTLGYYRYGTPAWKTELELAHKLGLKVWVRGHNGFSIDSPEIEKAAIEQIRQLRHHPALLFWEFQDEPLYNKVSVDNSRKGHRLVKREDPDHPLLTVEWPGVPERFSEWKGIGDIFGTDLYPIPRERAYGKLPNHDITQMRDYLEALRKAHGDRPLLLVLQGWAWDPLKDGEKGYPTVTESRFMAYQSVIHGARGLFYYGQFQCTKPNPAAGIAATSKEPTLQKAEFEKCQALNRQFWDRHRGFFKELTKASSIFTLPKAAEAITSTDAVIENATRKAADGELYLMAVNAGNKERQATFRLPAGSKAAEVHVLFEDRKLPVKDGTFVDRFRPYDTHVYSTTSKLPK
jgi:hypothetical protein